MTADGHGTKASSGTFNRTSRRSRGTLSGINAPEAISTESRTPIRHGSIRGEGYSSCTERSARRRRAGTRQVPMSAFMDTDRTDTDRTLLFFLIVECLGACFICGPWELERARQRYRRK